MDGMCDTTRREEGGGAKGGGGGGGEGGSDMTVADIVLYRSIFGP